MSTANVGLRKAQIVCASTCINSCFPVEPRKQLLDWQEFLLSCVFVICSQSRMYTQQREMLDIPVALGPNSGLKKIITKVVTKQLNVS